MNPSDNDATQPVYRITVDDYSDVSASLLVLHSNSYSSPILIKKVISNIGRNKDCEVCLQNTTGEVSRKHAQIIYTIISPGNRQYYIRDLGSVNGTFVNGIKLKPNEDLLLKDGDKIRIGPYTLKFVQPEHSNLSTLAGDLAHLDVYSIIQMIESAKTTGILTLQSDGTIGRIYFNEGLIVGADIKNKVAYQALSELLQFTKGHFQMEPSDLLFPIDIQTSGGSNNGLLLDLAREQDEKAHFLVDSEANEALTSSTLTPTATCASTETTRPTRVQNPETNQFNQFDQLNQSAPDFQSLTTSDPCSSASLFPLEQKQSFGKKVANRVYSILLQFFKRKTG